MKYTNVKLPMETLYMYPYDDICLLIRTLVGHECDEVLDASSGYSAEDCWEEGDIDYISDGLRYTLAYDFMEYDEDKWRVFRYASDPQPLYQM